MLEVSLGFFSYASHVPLASAAVATSRCNGESKLQMPKPHRCERLRSRWPLRLFKISSGHTLIIIKVLSHLKAAVMADEESVFGLIPPEPVKVVKAPLYVSKHPKIVVNKQASATFGKLENKPHPTQFLKKYEKTQSPPVKAPEELRAFHHYDHVKPAVPPRSEKPVMGLVSHKNFITANAVDNILAVPKKISHEKPDFVHKPDYGKVPQYLHRVKAQVDEEYRMIRAMQEVPDETSSQLKVLGEQERQEILNGLKANWERINKEYQTLGFALDSVSKKKKKEEYERMLEQIEKDIAKLHKSFVIIADDSLVYQ